jgi:DtxR family Mn-dependent transcriptional regulator
VSGALEDYLEAILVLERRKGAARVRDIAVELSVHKSTVTAALKQLAEKGFLNYSPYEIATLTKSGRRVAEDINRNHQTIRCFLTDVLGLGAKRAEANACRMEHVLDPVVITRMARLLRERGKGEKG